MSGPCCLVVAHAMCGGTGDVYYVRENDVGGSRENLAEGAGQVMIRWQFQVYTYIHMIWVLEKRRSHPSKKAPSFQCEKGPMILNFPLL